MELRAPSSKADAQWSLLSLAGILRDQESLVGGCHKFRRAGVTSQELAMSGLPHVCFPDILLAVVALCSLWTLCQDPHRAQVSLWLCWRSSDTWKLIFSKGCQMLSMLLDQEPAGGRAILTHLPGRRRFLLAQDPCPHVGPFPVLHPSQMMNAWCWSSGWSTQESEVLPVCCESEPSSSPLCFISTRF